MKKYFLLLCFLYLSCAHIGSTIKSISFPTAKLSNLHLNLWESCLSGNLQINNTTFIPLPMPQIIADLYLSGSYIGRAYNQYTGYIEPNCITEIPIRIDIDLVTALLSKFGSYFVTQQGTIKITIDIVDYYLIMDIPWEMASGKEKVLIKDFNYLQFVKKNTQQIKGD